MSIRTVIEINHDYLCELEQHPEYFEAFLDSLKGDKPKDVYGIRFLGQRHHSETLRLTIK